MLLGFFFLVWCLFFFVCFVAAAACLCEIFTFVLQKFEVSVGNIETATKRNLPVLGGGKIKLFRCKWHYYCCCYYYLNCSRVRLKKGSVCCCFDDCCSGWISVHYIIGNEYRQSCMAYMNPHCKHPFWISRNNFYPDFSPEHVKRTNKKLHIFWEPNPSLELLRRLFMEVNVIPGSVFVHPLVFFSILFSKYCLFCLFGPVVWLYVIFCLCKGF